MTVSKREEALAKELYESDMAATPGEYVPWDKQISYVHTHYRRIAVRVVKSRWFDEQLLFAAYNEAVAKDEEAGRHGSGS